SLRCRLRRLPRSRRVRWGSDFKQERKEANHMIHPPFRKRSAIGWLRHVPGAQTERRGGAETPHPALSPPRGEGKDEGWPAGVCLAVRTRRPLVRSGDQSSFRIVPMPRFLVKSELLLSPNRSR